ncbi:MAG TPA: alpha/beta hydrolase-fold protein [Chloroflexota bacterium]|nr:alpha/beta hydrolase-fold protein [Chloroflexota bacterium]
MRPRRYLARIVLAWVCAAAVAGWSGLSVDAMLTAAGSPASPVSLALRRPMRAEGSPADQRTAGVTVSEPPAALSLSAPEQEDLAFPEADPTPLPAVVPRELPPLPLPEPAAFGYVPRSRALHHDQLAAAFDGDVPQPRGQWREVRFFSRTLHREASYLIWLPPDYAGAGHAYPTLYLLHGVGGPAGVGKDEWPSYALAEDLDRMLALGLIQPMLVVLPEGERGYWVNHAGGGPRWADFVAFDLVQHVDLTFLTDATRLRRAIGGHSMGGHGALQLAMNHPDVFSVVGAHSPSLRPYETSPVFFGDLSWFSRHDPLTLAQRTTAARSLLTWIDVGHRDIWRPGAERLRQALAAQGAPLEFRVLEGEHQSWYWKHYLPEYLRFYTTALYSPSHTADGAPLLPGTPPHP